MTWVQKLNRGESTIEKIIINKKKPPYQIKKPWQQKVEEDYDSETMSKIYIELLQF